MRSKNLYFFQSFPGDMWSSWAISIINWVEGGDGKNASGVVCEDIFSGDSDLFAMQET